MSTTDREAGRAPGEASGSGPGSGAEDPLRIRGMTLDDLGSVVAIERASFGVPWTSSTFRSLLGRPGTGMWVAEVGGEVVGYAVVWAVLDQAELGNVAVGSAFRRRGIAGRLVETVVGWLEAQGVKEVFLEVRETNHGAQALYAAHGFEPVGRRKGYYSHPREDALVLRRAV